MTPTAITIEGTDEQVQLLEEAIDTYRMILMRLGGTSNVHIDNYVAERDEAMSFFKGQITLARSKA